MVVPKYTFKVVTWSPKYDGVPSHWFGSAEEWKRRAITTAADWERLFRDGKVTARTIKDNLSTARHNWSAEDMTWGVVVEQETENEYGEICP